MNDDLYRALGIDEVYFHKSLDFITLKKLQQRAEITLDVTDNIVVKHVEGDVILIFHHRTPNQSLIYRFLKLLSQSSNKIAFIKDRTLLNEEEVFEALKSKTFVLVSHRDLSTL